MNNAIESSSRFYDQRFGVWVFPYHLNPSLWVESSNYGVVV